MLHVVVNNSHTVRLTNSGTAAVTATLTSTTTGDARTATVASGATTTSTFTGGPVVPTTVDGDPATGWRAGGVGRKLVVDLGATVRYGAASATWGAGAVPDYRFLASTDGLNWVAASPGGIARYLAVQVQTWPAGAAAMIELTVPAG